MPKELTNNYGIPTIITDALTPKAYLPFGASDYSATGLIKSPRQLQLSRRHGNKVSEDFIDYWARFRGNCIHSALESALKDNPNYLIERKSTLYIKPEGGTEDEYRRVVAKLDAYDKSTKTLSDHKTTTTYIHGSEMKPEWINQLNINAYFCEKEGYPVDDVAINAIYMDWRANAAKYATDDSYPRTPFGEFKQAAWPMEWREKFVKERLRLHVDAEKLEDDKLPLCTLEEMWTKPEKFAVYKPGASRATKLCDSRDEAELYITQRKLFGYQIEHRRGERTMCENYCEVRDFCNQYREWKEAQESK